MGFLIKLKLRPQSIKCIIIGKDNKSDGQLFYVPHTRNIVGSSDYIMNSTYPSGPTFQLYYNGEMQFIIGDTVKKFIVKVINEKEL